MWAKSLPWKAKACIDKAGTVFILQGDSSTIGRQALEQKYMAKTFTVAAAGAWAALALPFIQFACPVLGWAAFWQVKHWQEHDGNIRHEHGE